MTLSDVREKLAGIGLDEREYRQSALTLSFKHSRPHRDTSTEFHTPSGPFTLVPLPGLRSSLVWVLDPRQADDIAALDDSALAAEIERRSPDGKWEPLQNLDLGAGYRLVEQCGPALIPTAPEAGACVELAPGHAFHPVPFRGLGCSAQCNGTCSRWNDLSVSR